MSQMEPAEGGIPISVWEEKLASVHKGPDAHRRPEEGWNAVMAHLAYMGEAIRRTNYRELLDAAAHTFAWMCSYVTQCNHTTYTEFLFRAGLSEIVGLKYPGVCGHCISSRCECEPVRVNAVADKSARYRELLNRGKHIQWEAYSVAYWLQCFWNIYAGRIHLQPMETIGFHLLEEAGEEARAVRQLVEFRGVLSHDIEGISQSFLELLSGAPGLIQEYEKSANEMKELKKKPSGEDAFAAIRNNESDPRVIRARLVRAKMRFVTEIADTFSWFCSVLLKARKTFADSEILKEYSGFDLLEAKLREVYGYPELTCYQCGETTCACIFFPEVAATAETPA